MVTDSTQPVSSATPKTAAPTLKVKPNMRFGNTGLWLRILLTLGILLSGMAVVFQVHDYRKSFTESQNLRSERKKLNTEWHKLLIEQQTFGATTQIGGRAVVSMGMYSPKHSEIITLNAVPAANNRTEAK